MLQSAYIAAAGLQVALYNTFIIFKPATTLTLQFSRLKNENNEECIKEK